MSAAETCNVLLYSYFRSSCSWRVRAFLAYKSVKFEYKPVNILKFEHKQPSYLELNPQGQVPTLVYNGRVMSESVTILEFLEEMHRDVNRAMPDDPFKRQVVRQICMEIAAYIQPLQNPFLASKIAKRYGDESSEKQAFIKKDWPVYVLEDGFTALERLLDRHSGKFCVGDDITLADFYLVPQVFNATRFGLEMTGYPNIKRINDTLLEEDCFKVSHPSMQPDTPKE